MTGQAPKGVPYGVKVGLMALAVFILIYVGSYIFAGILPG